MSSEQISLQIQLSDLTCPLTHELFYEPKILGTCGHSVENDVIPKLQNTCPICRVNFNTVAPDLRAKNYLKSIFLTHENLRKDQYFSVRLLEKELHKPHLSDDLLPVLLSKSTEFFNSIEPNSSTSLSIQLCLRTNGRKLLASHQALRAKISPTALNHIITAGEAKDRSGTYCLCTFADGQALLSVDAALRAKISPTALNHIITAGEAKDRSGTFSLISSEGGLALLKVNVGLRARIHRTALNHIITVGPFQDMSGTFCLCANRDGQALLSVDAALRAKISPTALNHIITAGEAKDRSGTFSLISSKGGLALLHLDAALRAKISQTALNHIITVGPFKDMSSAFYLCTEPDGQALLNLDAALRAKISQTALNHIITMGIFKDKSPLYYLCKTSVGVALLTIDKALRAKISQAALNHRVAEKNICAALILCLHDAGLELLISDQALRNKIDWSNLDLKYDLSIEHLNGHKGKTFRTILSEIPLGQRLLSLIFAPKIPEALSVEKHDASNSQGVAKAAVPTLSTPLPSTTEFNNNIGLFKNPEIKRKEPINANDETNFNTKKFRS